MRGHEPSRKQIFGFSIGVFLLAVVVNLAFLAGAAWVVFTVAKAVLG